MSCLTKYHTKHNTKFQDFCEGGGGGGGGDSRVGLDNFEHNRCSKASRHNASIIGEFSRIIYIFIKCGVCTMYIIKDPGGGRWASNRSQCVMYVLVKSCLTGKATQKYYNICRYG